MTAQVIRAMAMRSLLTTGVLCTVVAAAAGGCSKSPVAYGAPNSIIVIAADPLWQSVADTVSAVLEPRIFTVREERTFDLTHASPADPATTQLRMWRQVLVIGEADDPWVAPALENAGQVPTELPAFFEVGEVWARGQEVTVVLLPPGGGRSALLELLPELHTYVDGRFRDYVRGRMFVSGANTELRDELARTAGFSLLVPNVYRHGEADGVYIFRNDQQRRYELIRSVVVTWRPGAPPEPVTPEWLIAWRDSLSVAYHDPAQVVNPSELEVRELAGGGLEVRGIWNTLPDDWPGAGPFVDRVIICPEQDRTYLADAWLYAPGQAKYEFMLQLETIVDSFSCGTT